MRRHVDLIRMMGALSVFLLILLDPSAAREAAWEALAAWGRSVAPALLPMLMALPALTSGEALALYERLLGRAMRPLFGCEGSMAAAAIVGWIGGSPAGAIALAGVCAQRDISLAACLRCALLASGASPVYLLCAVAAGMLAAPQYGWVLVRAQFAAVIFSGLLCKHAIRDRGRLAARPAQSERGASGAVLQVASIAAYMAFFGVLARQLSLLLGPLLEVPLLAVLELAGGCQALADSALPIRWQLPLISAVACFGGLSACAQCMAHLRPLGLRTRNYLLGKALQALLAFGFCRLQLAWPGAAPAFLWQGDARTDPLAASALLSAGLLLPPILWLAARMFPAKSEPVRARAGRFKAREK